MANSNIEVRIRTVNTTKKPPEGMLYCKTCVLRTPKGKVSKRPFTYRLTAAMMENLSPGAIHQLGCCPNCGEPMHYMGKGGIGKIMLERTTNEKKLHECKTVRKKKKRV